MQKHASGLFAFDNKLLLFYSLHWPGLTFGTDPLVPIVKNICGYLRPLRAIFAGVLFFTICSFNHNIYLSH